MKQDTKDYFEQCLQDLSVQAFSGLESASFHSRTPNCPLGFLE
jgi:hypothetical protein